jgi:alpha-methylacyl-CoA racemase
MQGALDGIRVLDFSTLLPGPMATLFMAEAGAEVIKVERPGQGEEMRVYAPHWGEDSANFHLLNRGKRSLALDLKKPEDRARLTPLIATSDVLVEQFRPGVMARLGLSYEEVRAIKPDIVYCSITGYGQSGPRSAQAGHDLNYQGETGLLALSLGPATAPVIPPALIADIAGGTYPALVNILLALRRRDRTGEPAHLDIAMAENLFPFLYWAQGEGQVSGEWPGNGTSLVTGGGPRYQLYPTADGRVAAVAAIEQKFWNTFCELIGLEPALRDDALDPVATRLAVAGLIAAQPSEHWAADFAAADCCCSIVRTLREAMDDPHFRARGVFAGQIANARGEKMAALPTAICPPFRAHPGETRNAPLLGEYPDDGRADTTMGGRP